MKKQDIIALIQDNDFMNLERIWDSSFDVNTIATSDDIVQLRTGEFFLGIELNYRMANFLNAKVDQQFSESQGRHRFPDVNTPLAPKHKPAFPNFDCLEDFYEDDISPDDVFEWSKMAGVSIAEPDTSIKKSPDSDSSPTSEKDVVNFLSKRSRY